MQFEGMTRSHSATISSKKAVVVREVWQENVEEEFDLIRSIVPQFSFVAMDTEFPGVIFRPSIDQKLHHQLHPVQNYQLMKPNVDSLNIIQLGLTLSDAHGNLPDLGSDVCYIWEFNFRDFDIDVHKYNLDSIELLRRQGIDIEKNTKQGIHSCQFARLFLGCGLICNYSITWIIFHGSYDFGLLLSILIGGKLSRDLENFMKLVKFHFGTRVYDLKCIARYCKGLFGGLEKVAATLKVDRIAGKSHQAGSDSLLTLQTFMKMITVFFTGMMEQFNMCGGLLYGLEVTNQRFSEVLS